MNSYEARLDVPELNAAGLSSSSLILADAMEKIPAKAIIGSMFTIGDTKVARTLEMSSRAMKQWAFICRCTTSCRTR